MKTEPVFAKSDILSLFPSFVWIAELERQDQQHYYSPARQGEVICVATPKRTGLAVSTGLA